MFKWSKILPALGNFFKGIFTDALPTLEASAKAELATVETSVIAFAASDLGKLAIDSVAIAAQAGHVGDPAFAAAKVQFIADAKVAGHDLEAIGSGIVDWMIQTAYTYTAGVFSTVGKLKA